MLKIKLPLLLRESPKKLANIQHQSTLSQLLDRVSLAEKEVPVSAISKEAARLLLQPRLDSEKDGGLGTLPIKNPIKPRRGKI